MRDSSASLTPSLLLFDISGGPAIGVARILLWSAICALLLFLGYAGYEGWHPELVASFSFVGALIAFFLWGAHRIWTLTVLPAVTGQRLWVRVLTRIPFWFLAGGGGYEAGMLTAKKLGWLAVHDRPVALLFLSGGKFAVAAQLAAVILCSRIGRRGRTRFEQ